MDGVSITAGSLWLVEEGNIGLRYIGMDILQSNAHRAHGDGKILESGEKIEEMVWGKCKFSRFDTLR